MKPMDFSAHNEEVRTVWEAYHAGRPVRVPMILGVNPRIIMGDPSVNTRRYSFRDYFEDPQTLLECQLLMQYYSRHRLFCDQEMGVPSAWPVFIDLMNIHECSWLGGEVVFPPGQVPFCGPFLTEDNKRSIFDRGIPEVFSGIYARVAEFREYIENKAETFEYMGSPVFISGCTGMGTDGPLTVCCDIRGAGEFLTDLGADTGYALELLDFVTEAIIRHLKAFRTYMFGDNAHLPVMGFADDSVQLISQRTYTELILPFHKRIVDALRYDSPVVSMHVCGDAQRHHKAMVEELGIGSIDTGFPMDFAAERSLVGDECEILGGPSVPFLEAHTPEEVYRHTRDILTSGIADSGRFILREGNNLPPTVPVENTYAMYRACRETMIY
ncbi:MAG: hypothetical protein IJT95_00095 [Abditibacteriota bacterium]|nr:hypothetical protein [Abditibacteriota bacterium]